MILKYYHTLKYLKQVQIYGRICSKIKKPISVYNLPELKLTPIGISNKTPFLNHDTWNNKEKLLKNEFSFLNKSHQFGKSINWHNKSLPLLWMFNLHYFNYLHLLIKSEQELIIIDWIENNPIGSGPGWHPYPLSLRIVNWIKADIKNKTINESLYKQCAYLYRNLEFYHPANHYLENAKALIFAGLYFINQGEANKWLKKGLKIYLTETPKQVLNDGGYFERSTMYHATILEGYLDIINILPEQYKDYDYFEKTAGRMLNFLIAATHPDGNISLFNDSTQEIAPLTKELIGYAGNLNVDIENSAKQKYINEFKDSGYSVYSDENIYLIIKSGKIGPDNIPAHSHADIFSYELSYKGKKLITDSGVYEYAAGVMRNYCRSTKAHNTVTIDGMSQAEMWGSFRVARRFEPIDVRFNDLGDKVLFEGKFDGYSKLLGDNLIHQRSIKIENNLQEITIEDGITGSGKHLVESFIHLHPDIKINKVDDYLVLSRENAALKLLIINCNYSIEYGWYCPEFGKQIQNQVIRIFSNQLPGSIIYKFCVCS
jgi:uncharacterized heparinase superfamily protein